MIGKLKGIVNDIEGQVALIDVGGVCYEVYVSYQCMVNLKVGQEAEIIIYTDVKEDSIRLYGFLDKLEKQVFKLLLEVKGVGTKSASELISKIDKIELLRAIGENDLEKIVKVKGLGKKTAERILLELTDKVIKSAGEYIENVKPSNIGLKTAKVSLIEQEAILALKGLGFLQSVATNAVTQAKNSTEGQTIKDTASLVKLSLKYV